VRTPAWLCGVVGFKPTFGRVGRGGVIPFSSSCDHVGPLARTVEDAALVLQAIAGHNAHDAASSKRDVPDFRSQLTRGVRGMRVAVLRHHFEEDTHASPELVRAVDAALDLLRDLGAEVENLRVRSLHDYYSVRVMLSESELFARHQHHLREHSCDYGDHFLGRTLAATLFSSADYIAAQRERRRIIAEMQPLYAKYDAFVTTGAGPAPHLRAHRAIGAVQKWSTPSMGTMFSVTGAPAIALPCGFSAEGLPLGMQIAGRPFEEPALFAIAHAYERAAGWWQRHPKLVAHVRAPDIDRGETVGESVEPALEIRRRVEAAVQQAGLALDARALALLHESAPHALELARRLPRDRPWTDEQAAVFTLDE
jgi:aspartyl-tRNA(Asn)/glutamyl-tRNA(Gln) amidotransferase subunit A